MVHYHQTPFSYIKMEGKQFNLNFMSFKDYSLVIKNFHFKQSSRYIED